MKWEPLRHRIVNSFGRLLEIIRNSMQVCNYQSSISLKSSSSSSCSSGLRSSSGSGSVKLECFLINQINTAADLHKSDTYKLTQTFKELLFRYAMALRMAFRYHNPDQDTSTLISIYSLNRASREVRDNAVAMLDQIIVS